MAMDGAGKMGGKPSRNQRAGNVIQGARAWWRRDSLYAALGTALIVVMLVVAMVIPEPTDFQRFVFRVALAIAAALVGRGVGGFLTFFLGASSELFRMSVRAGGAVGLFLVLYLVDPANHVLNHPPEGIRISDPRVVASSGCRGIATIQATLIPSSYQGSVYSIVRMEESSAWFIQNPCSKGTEGWRCDVQLGEPATPCGTRFEVVLAAIRKPLIPGPSSALPSGTDARSRSLRMER